MVLPIILFAEFRGTPMPADRRYRVQDRACSFEKLSAEQINKFEESIPDDDDILGCYECQLIVDKVNPSFTERLFSPTVTSFHTIVITQSCLISAIFGDMTLFNLEDEDKEPRSMLLADIVDIQENQDTEGAKHYHVTVKAQGTEEEYYTFASKQTAKKFVTVLKQAVTQVKVGPSANSEEQKRISEQLSKITEKTFQWHWVEKNQKGVIYALFDERSLRLTLYTKPGIGVATGKGRLPSDFYSIGLNILSTFTIEGVPVYEYALQKSKEDTGRLELEVKHDSDELGANLAILRFDSRGLIQSTTNFRVSFDYERLSTPTDTRQLGPSILSWIALCSFLDEKGKPIGLTQDAFELLVT